jgi:hypothetical protein
MVSIKLQLFVDITHSQVASLGIISSQHLADWLKVELKFSQTILRPKERHEHCCENIRQDESPPGHCGLDGIQTYNPSHKATNEHSTPPPLGAFVV